VTPYQIIHEVRKYGWLLLMGNGRLHVELPGGHKELLAELKTQKERVRAVLVARENAKKKRKALRLAAPPLVGKPVSIPMASTLIRIFTVPSTLTIPMMSWSSLRFPARRFGAS